MPTAAGSYARLLDGQQLRAALSRIVVQRGGDPDSQRDRAQVAEISQSALSYYETGARPVPERIALRLRVEELEAENAALRSQFVALQAPPSFKLFSIGYQLRSQEELIQALRKAGVSLLVDVREVPWSRRAEHSQKRLRIGLEPVGISYEHAKFAGNPKRFRTEANSHRECLEKYEHHIRSTPEIVEQFDARVKAWQTDGIVPSLFCYERHPDDCHRSIILRVWAEVTGSQAEIHHLAPEGAPRFL